MIIAFPHERSLTRPVFLLWLRLTVCVSISVSSIPGGCDHEYFDDCNVWKTCSYIYGFMQQFRLNGASAECLAQALLSCCMCVYEGMVGLLELCEWCGASWVLIFCNFHRRLLLPSVHFWLSIIFNVLEFYLRNTPKNTAFQTHAFLFLQTLKITYLCKWDLSGKCLIRSSALCQITYSCKILVFLTLFLHRPEAKFG